MLLPISRERVLELGGFAAHAAPALLDPRGGRLVHACAGAGIGLGAGAIALAVLTPEVRWPLAATVVIAIAALVALLADADRIGWVGIALAGGAAIWMAISLGHVRAATWVGSGVTALAVAAAVTGGARCVRAMRRRRAGFDVLSRLHADVDRFNALVRLLEIGAQLSPGAHRPPEERARIMGALMRTREELERALSAERLLRENRDLLRMPLGELELLPPETTRVRAESEEQAALVNEALAIAAHVRDELESLKTR